jgi:hypothetical protein
MNPALNRKRGKRTERAIAKHLNGKRLGILGNHDVEAGPWAVEVKDRKRFSGSKFMEQAVRNAPAGKTPLVVVHETGSRHSNDLVMMRMSDWLDWFGPLGGEQ